MKKLSAVEMLSAMQAQGDLDPKIAKRLKAMYGGMSKRGVTKKAFNRKKARAKNKMARAARKANRGFMMGKKSSASYGGNGANRASV